MEKETMLSDIKNINSVLAGIKYASMNANPTERYLDDSEFLIGYNVATRLQQKNSVLIKTPKIGKKSSSKCK